MCNLTPLIISLQYCRHHSKSKPHHFFGARVHSLGRLAHNHGTAGTKQIRIVSADASLVIPEQPPAVFRSLVFPPSPTVSAPFSSSFGGRKPLEANAKANSSRLLRSLSVESAIERRRLEQAWPTQPDPHPRDSKAQLLFPLKTLNSLHQLLSLSLSASLRALPLFKRAASPLIH